MTVTFKVTVTSSTHPFIMRLEMDGYTGQAGGIIDIIVTDDFAMVTVNVKIINDQGEIIESGHASAASDGYNRWNHLANVNITTPVTIEVVAKDFPGGVTVSNSSSPDPATPLNSSSLSKPT